MNIFLIEETGFALNLQHKLRQQRSYFMISELLSFEFEMFLLDSHVSTLASQLMALFQMVMELLRDGSLQGQALKFCSWVQLLFFLYFCV